MSSFVPTGMFATTIPTGSMPTRTVAMVVASSASPVVAATAASPSTVPVSPTIAAGVPTPPPPAATTTITISSPSSSPAMPPSSQPLSLPSPSLSTSPLPSTTPCSLDARIHLRDLQGVAESLCFCFFCQDPCTHMVELPCGQHHACHKCAHRWMSKFKPAMGINPHHPQWPTGYIFNKLCPVCGVDEDVTVMPSTSASSSPSPSPSSSSASSSGAMKSGSTSTTLRRALDSTLAQVRPPSFSTMQLLKVMSASEAPKLRAPCPYCKTNELCDLKHVLQCSKRMFKCGHCKTKFPATMPLMQHIETTCTGWSCRDCKKPNLTQVQADQCAHLDKVKHHFVRTTKRLFRKVLRELRSPSTPQPKIGYLIFLHSIIPQLFQPLFRKDCEMIDMAQLMELEFEHVPSARTTSASAASAASTFAAASSRGSQNHPHHHPHPHHHVDAAAAGEERKQGDGEEEEEDDEDEDDLAGSVNPAENNAPPVLDEDELEDERAEAEELRDAQAEHDAAQRDFGDDQSSEEDGEDAEDDDEEEDEDAENEDEVALEQSLLAESDHSDSASETSETNPPPRSPRAST